MKKPIIGITPQLNAENGDYVCRLHYMNCVVRAGGFPILLPMCEDMTQALEICDGFIFAGGPDVDPRIYGEVVMDCCGKISAPRDRYELQLISSVLQAGKSMMAICRGVQVLNVALGGTLYQDLPTQKPSEVCHQMTAVSNKTIHRVDILRDTPLYQLLAKDELMVNSYHHQSIKDLGGDLKIAAMSEDGIVESVYLPTHPFCLGLQWHPERLENEDTERIFRAMIEASESKK